MSDAKVSKNLRLDADTVAKGEALVIADHRANFSNLVNALIAEKYAALVAEGKIQPKAEVVS
jgi:hypothetical protein